LETLNPEQRLKYQARSLLEHPRRRPDDQRRDIGVLSLNNQRQRRTLLIHKDLLPYTLC
jgi:hypothetical protein